MNNQEDIRVLLSRFYCGETSIDEERRLISVLLSETCPDELREERYAIISLARDEAITMPDGMEQKNAAIPAAYTNQSRRWWMGIAVGVLIVIGIGFWALFPKDASHAPAPSLDQHSYPRAPMAETVKPAPSVQPQSERPTAEKPRKSVRTNGPKPVSTETSADMPKIDIAAEMTDILANIDQLEQQILVTTPQNNN